MKEAITLLKTQNNRPGNSWHIKLPEGLPAVCVQEAMLRRAQTNNLDWASTQRMLEVEWDATNPSFFDVRGKEDARIHARDVCRTCAAGLLKRFYEAQKGASHAER